jgi:O-antigen/teichoic acid export membrane protein
MRVVSALLTAGLTLFLVRKLGPHDYGVYALALSVGGVVLLPADLGVTRSAARFIAERRDNMAQVVGVVRHGIRLKALGSGVVALGLLIAAGPIADAYGTPSLKTALWIVALALVLQSFFLFFTTTFEALGRNSVGFRLTTAESALEVSAALGLVLAGAGVSGALVGRAIGYGFGAALGAVLMVGIVRRGEALRRASASASTSALTARRIVRYAGTIFVIDAAFAAFGYIDVLLIGAFLDAAAAGAFNAPLQLIVPAEYLALALAAGIGPRLAGNREAEPDTEALRGALRIVLGFQFMLAVLCVVWAPSIVDLALGSDYGASVDVLRALGPFLVMAGVGPLLALSVNYLGEARRRIPLALAAVAVNALLDVILIPKIGIVAGAIGTDVAFLVFVVGHFVIIRRLIDLPLRPLALTLARVALASLAMAAVLVAFGTGKLGIPQLLVGGVLAVTAYVAALIATGELTPSHLRTARGYASTVFGR